MKFEVYRLTFDHADKEVGMLWQRNAGFMVANSAFLIIVGMIQENNAFACRHVTPRCTALTGRFALRQVVARSSSTSRELHEGEAMQFKIRTVVSGAMTEDKVSVFSEVTSPGGGPPLHRHVAQMELFHVIKGRHKFVLGDKEMVALPGDCILIPIGAAHSFKNIDSDEGLLHFELLPSGSSERFFKRLVEDYASIDDMPAFFREHGLELLGPPLS